jgi:hypothetical protein
MYREVVVVYRAAYKPDARLLRTPVAARSTEERRKDIMVCELE